MAFRPTPEHPRVSLAHRHAQLEMWLLESVERHDERPSKATVGASITMVAGFMLLLLSFVLPAAFAPWVFVVGCVSVVVGGVTLAVLPGPYRRLFEEAKRRGLPGLHLTAARWATNGEGCMDAWRDLAVTKLRWCRYCDRFPMTADDHTALAESLRRCARRRHPGSLQLSPPQSAYLQQAVAPSPTTRTTPSHR